MLRFASLGSGSKGNATLLEVGDTRILLDCGFSVRETERRLERLGQSGEGLQGILVTHEHSDHIRGVGALSRKYSLPVWLTAGTLRASSDPDFYQTHIIHAHDNFTIGECHIEPFPVPHDASEPCQYVFSDGNRRLGILTDTGSLTPHIERMLNGVHGLLLECNYDTAMLEQGPYPLNLKRRVGGRYGHLANDQAAALLQRLDLAQLDCLIGMHVSENNNTPELAFAALDGSLDRHPGTLMVACQQEGFDWQIL
jgi:phosphoribosyl 1,2-cyclic phosphodiesterase